MRSSTSKWGSQRDSRSGSQLENITNNKLPNGRSVWICKVMLATLFPSVYGVTVQPISPGTAFTCCYGALLAACTTTAIGLLAGRRDQLAIAGALGAAHLMRYGGSGRGAWGSSRQKYTQRPGMMGSRFRNLTKLGTANAQNGERKNDHSEHAPPAPKSGATGNGTNSAWVLQGGGAKAHIFGFALGVGPMAQTCHSLTARCRHFGETHV